MIPTLLITLREVVEASIIVATILGLLTKLNQTESVKHVWIATICAFFTSFFLVFEGAIIGVNIQKIYAPVTEGFLYILSAFFITWAIFTLHKRFGQKKLQLLQTMNNVIGERGIFMFTFTAVLREGIEIALFLSTVYLTTSPIPIIAGFSGGIALGIFVSLLFFSASIRIPVYWTFRATSYLLIFFAGRALAQGIGEFHIHTIQTLPALASLTYIFFMHRWVFVRSR